METICIIDASLPPYAAPLARECVATVLVAPRYQASGFESLSLTLQGVTLLVIAVVILVRVFRG